METLVVVAAQHKNQFYTAKSIPQGLERFNSSPLSKLGEINCRSFHAADGILPTPLRASSIPVTKQTPPSLKTPAKSSPIPITAKPFCSEELSDEGFYDGRSLSFSERWAGPTYSNSPPPSSLPMPKFLKLSRRANSLTLPSVVSVYDVSVHQISKSAPTSPTREFSPPPFTKALFPNPDSATQALRRILNLEPSDE